MVDNGLFSWPIAHLPGFAIRNVSSWEFSFKNLLQLMPAPDTLHVEGFESNNMHALGHS